MATSPQSVVDVSVGENTRYVDWTAIFAGAILASAISFVLFTFGTGIGLSLTSPYPGESVNIVTFAIALGLWVLWVSTSSFIAGAYLTGRMRRRVADTTEHEVEVRDAAHGILVWAVSVLIGGLIAAWIVGGVASKTADVAAGAATGATAAATQEVAEQADPTSYWTDVLFRPGAAAPSGAAAAPAATTTEAATAPAATTTTTTSETTTAPATTTTTSETTTAPATTTTAEGTTTAATPAAPAATTTPPPTAAGGPASVNNEQTRQAVQRIMSSRITDDKLIDDDRAYLTRVVMDTTRLSEADASARVDAAVTGLNQAKAEAQRLADKARKFGILVTFLTAASLAIGAAASWWAAVVGGRHHDQATDFSHFFGRRV
jgi:hypothetical protein